MLLYIIKWTVIYFILILLLHNLYLFFQKNLTTTKTKDYYNFPNNEYKKINNILNSNNTLSEKKLKNNNTSTNSKIVLDSKFDTFSNIDFSLTSNKKYNNDSKIFNNYNADLTTKNIETSLEKNSTLNLEKFNSQLQNNNMKNELEEFLNKLNN